MIPAPVAEGTAQSDSSSFVFGAQILINFGESGLLENEPRYPQSRHTKFCFSLLVIVVWFSFVFGLSFICFLWAKHAKSKVFRDREQRQSAIRA